MNDDDILAQYPFLKITNTIKEYVEPEYYNKLLKPYIFGGKTDLDLFQAYIDGFNTNPQKILELCSGSGRVSRVAINEFESSAFTLSDLSTRMLAHVKAEFSDIKVKFVESDAVNFLENATETYDFVYTLWGFSHSVHQHAHDIGIDGTTQLLDESLAKFIKSNLTSGGKLYLVHFDSMSEEQSILMRQWKRVYETFSNLETQSPSKLMLDSTLSRLDNSNQIYLTQKHLQGDPIIYQNKNELLEIFLNFHLETYFNNSSLLGEVVADIEEQIKRYEQPNGSYSIRPGCYIYEIVRR